MDWAVDVSNQEAKVTTSATSAGVLSLELLCWRPVAGVAIPTNNVSGFVAGAVALGTSARCSVTEVTILMTNTSDLIIGDIIPMIGARDLTTGDTISTTGAKGTITRDTILAINVGGLITKATNAGGLVTGHTILAVDSSSSVIETFGTSDYSG